MNETEHWKRAPHKTNYPRKNGTWERPPPPFTANGGAAVEALKETPLESITKVLTVPIRDEEREGKSPGNRPKLDSHVQSEYCTAGMASEGVNPFLIVYDGPVGATKL